MQVIQVFVLAAALLGCAKGDPVERAKAAMKAGDHKEALVLAQPAAQAGDPRAQVVVGLLFSQGQGVPEDPATAVAWFRKAADQGYASGQFDLGLMYEDGAGVEQSDVEAYKWYSLAAAQGDADAARNLKELAGRLKKAQIAEGKKRAAAFKKQ